MEKREPSYTIGGNVSLYSHLGEQYVDVVVVTKLCSTLTTPLAIAQQALLSMGFPRQEYGVGCHFLLQGIFPTHGSNLHLLHFRQILCH